MKLLFALVPVASLLAQTPPTGRTPAPAAAAKPVARPITSSPKPPVAAGAVRPASARPAGAAKALPKGAPLATDDEKAIYALGLSIHRSLTRFDLSPAELDIVKRALSDAASGKPASDLNDWGPKIDPLGERRASRASDREKAASKAYAAKAAAEPGAEKSSTGMIYRELKAGAGPAPTAADTVKVHYRGTLTNGTEFDSSYKRNEPTQFPLRGVIPCWTEGVQKIKAGGKGLLVCPSEIAYGDRGRPPVIPGGATLVFEIELLEVIAAPDPPATPPPPPPAPAPPKQP